MTQIIEKLIDGEDGHTERLGASDGSMQSTLGTLNRVSVLGNFVDFAARIAHPEIVN